MTDNIINFTNQDYRIIEKTTLHQGFFHMMRYQLQFRLYQGGWSNIVTRELMERYNAAAILPYDPILDKIVLIEQFRPGAINREMSPWLVEVVAGVLEKGDAPDYVAKKEAQEEAACQILDLVPICEYFVSPGGTNEYLWLFCGRIDASQAGGIHGLHEEDEDIHTIVLSLEEAVLMLQQGKIKTSPAIISLQWLQLNRERLKTLWQNK